MPRSKEWIQAAGIDAVDVLVMRGHDAAWESVVVELERIGLSLRRVEAIDGASVSPEEIRASLTPRARYELGVARRYPHGWVHEGVQSRSTVGCYLSHVELWGRVTSRTGSTMVLEQLLRRNLPATCVSAA